MPEGDFYHRLQDARAAEERNSPPAAETSEAPEEGWPVRMRRFFDTWDYDLISQDDVDKFHEHLTWELRVRAFDALANDGEDS